MLEKIKEILTHILPDIDTEKLNENTRLSEELGFDSINMTMLCIELEETFGFRFSHPVHFETLTDICGYLDSRI